MYISQTAQYITGWKSEVPLGLSAMHYHDAYELVYHQYGNGIIRLEKNASHPFRRSTIEIMLPKQRHAQLQKHVGTDCCIHFHASNPIAKKLDQWLSLEIPEDQYAANEIKALSVLPKPHDQIEQQIYDCRLTALILTLLTHAGLMQTTQNLSRRDQLAQECYEYIRTNWRDIQQVQQIADQLSVSPDYLRHVFREQHGMTIHDCITQMRINHAKDLLRNSQLPQKVMAQVCGFADIQQFSRRFKQITGITPGQYRKPI